MSELRVTDTPADLGQFGVDVARQRADDLDRIMLADAAATPTATFLDLGSGAGGQSLRLAQAGARVQAVDGQDMEGNFAVWREELALPVDKLQFAQADMLAFVADQPNASFSHACVQRSLHYLPYETAARLLRELARVVTTRAYISVTGIDSAIGQLHLERHTPIVARFAALPRRAVETFMISEPLCVYSEAEFRTLLTASGWQINQLWCSAFGNLKVTVSPMPNASPHTA